MVSTHLRTADDFRAAITVYEEDIPLASAADKVWSELATGDHRFLPGTHVDWITATPHGVGTLRVMNCGPVHLRSRYFAWDESNRYKAFYLENPPVGFRELVEQYHVTARGSGSVLSYRLAIVPNPAIRPLVPALSAYITFLMRNWHLRFIKRRFGGDPADPDAGTDPAGPSVRMPPGPSMPKLLQGFWFALARRQMIQSLTRQYGDAFTITMPTVGRVVVVTDPELAKETFQVSPEDLGNLQPNLSTRLLGPGSVFALDGAAHKRRRNLLTPPFNGKSVRVYDRVFAEETLREAADWPIGEPFGALDPMLRIALNGMLRAIFGAEGRDLEELRRVIPPWVTLGQRLVTLPMPDRTFGRFTPWGRLAGLRHRYEAVVDTLIARVQADPALMDRTDVLSVLLRSADENGDPMSRADIGDELLTFLAAGHETTAATLSWVFERISRDAQLLAALVAEVDASENTLRRATIREVQRTRTVVDFAGRHVYAPATRLGDWVIPRGSSVMVFISQIHVNPAAFDDPGQFEPQRFVTANPVAHPWIPYGGGTRRCPGATFANITMDAVLRTVLQHFVIEPTGDAPEQWHARGVAFTPKDGGRIVVRPRSGNVAARSGAPRSE